jgi:hypothetical protein
MAFTNEDLDKWEYHGCSLPDSWEKQMIRQLVSEVRKLYHQASDPNYLYSCDRIHRQSIIVRDSEIYFLHEENARLKEELKKGKE